MKKVIAIATVVALACGGAGIALGATMARASTAASSESGTASEAPEAFPAIRTREAAPAVPRAPEPRAAEPRAVETRVAEPTVRAGDVRPATPATPSEIRVRRLVVTSGIEAREPVDTIGTMAAGEHDRVYAFVELANRGGEGSVVVTFERDGEPRHGEVELEAPARAGRWRTWAFTRGVRQAGEWRAVVRDHEGRVLAEQSFVVE